MKTMQNSGNIRSREQYCLLSGILAQPRSHIIQKKQTVICEAPLESMQNCRSSLQEFIARETNNTSTDGTLAHELTYRSSCDGAIPPKLSPGFLRSVLGSSDLYIHY